MPMLLMPTRLLEQLETAVDLHAQCLKNEGQQSAAFSVAVLELVKARAAVADYALGEWKTVAPSHRILDDGSWEES